MTLCGEEAMHMSRLDELRSELDAVDREIVALFEKRMTIARGVAQFKLENDMQVLDRLREAAVLESRAAMLHDACWEDDVRMLYETIMACSRREQEKCIREAQTND